MASRGYGGVTASDGVAGQRHDEIARNFAYAAPCPSRAYRASISIDSGAAQRFTSSP